MEGKVLWYKPGIRRGCVVTDSGDHLAFAADGDDSRIQGGARLRFRISDTAEHRMAVNVEVICPSEQALAAEAAPWLSEFRRLISCLV